MIPLENSDGTKWLSKVKNIIIEISITTRAGFKIPLLPNLFLNRPLSYSMNDHLNRASVDDGTGYSGEGE